MDPLDWIALITWTIATYIQFSRSSTGDRQWYDENRSEVSCAPPGWLFGFVWLLLYGLMSAAIFLFWRNNAASTLYNAVLIVYLANLLLNKVWSVVFFDMGNREGSLFVIGLVNLTAAATLVLLIIDGDAWLPFALLLPYQLWLLLAAFLNLRWFMLYLPTRNGAAVRRKVVNASVKTTTPLVPGAAPLDGRRRKIKPGRRLRTPQGSVPSTLVKAPLRAASRPRRSRKAPAKNM